MKKIDLILIGNELLNGKIQDRNTKSLSDLLYEKNLELRKVHIIRDNEEDFFEALDESQKYSDIIITSGGLGPTKDDLTKSMLAKYFNKDITHSEQTQTIALIHYDRGGRAYDSEKIHYHKMPKDFTALLNPVGYAPGLSFKGPKATLFALPGVPSEFTGMLKESVLPTLAVPSTEIIKHVIIRTSFIPESKIFTDFDPLLWEKLEDFGEVSSLPHLMGVDIGVKISSNTEVEIKKTEQKVLAIIHSTKLGEHIWNIGPESLEEVIIKKALAKNLKIGFAESCTGGLLASRITDVSGSSSVFWGSIISYSNDVKIKSLNVMQKTLADHGAVSAQTAKEMAQGAFDVLAVDIAISTTGIAGPNGGTKEKPVGTVGIGICSNTTKSGDLFEFKGDRQTLKLKFSEFALFKLLEQINEYKK